MYVLYDCTMNPEYWLKQPKQLKFPVPLLINWMQQSQVLRKYKLQSQFKRI